MLLLTVILVHFLLFVSDKFVKTFQAVEASVIRTRLDVVLRNPETNKRLKQFSMACNFLSPLTGLF